MNPAFSVVFFTTLAGAAQGLVVTVAAFTLFGGDAGSPAFRSWALALAAALSIAGLGASFLHLGRPERAWRTATMWRTSWLSREVIVLPAFIGVVAFWWLGLQRGWDMTLVAAAAVVVSVLLWVCTAMIYACLRFVREWAHPLTLVNYTLIGLSSGLVLACALAAVLGDEGVLQLAGPWALAATLVAWATRIASLRRNAKLGPVSTLQSATGIPGARVVQRSMGMTGGAFNTREFFHGATAAALRNIRLTFHVLGFGLPAALVAWGLLGAGPFAWIAALVIQAPGLVAERWFFFAQARHPQNLYYQVVS